MKSLVIYTSKHGTTKKIATYLQDNLQCEGVNLLTDDAPALDEYDLIILGGSIYYGTVHSKLTCFIEDNLDTLLSKKIALFLVCLMSEETAAEQFNNNFNQTLLNHSHVDGFFGGVLQKDTLNPVEKVVTSFVFKNIDISGGLYFDEVDKFIEALNL